MNPPQVLDDLPASSDSSLVAAAPECKGIRATSDFPRDLSGLSPEQIARTYSAMRKSHASLAPARGQMQRRSRELRAARDRFLATLHGYEGRLVAIGKGKTEALSMAQELHRSWSSLKGSKGPWIAWLATP